MTYWSGWEARLYGQGGLPQGGPEREEGGGTGQTEKTGGRWRLAWRQRTQQGGGWRDRHVPCLQVFTAGRISCLWSDPGEGLAQHLETPRRNGIWCSLMGASESQGTTTGGPYTVERSLRRSQVLSLA